MSCRRTHTHTHTHTHTPSHSIFIVEVEQRDCGSGVRKNGRLYMVDLAGSEKVARTGAAGVTLDEAKMINRRASAHRA